MSPQANIKVTVAMALLATAALVYASGMMSWWWVMLVMTGTYLLGTGYTIWLEMKNLASAQLMRQVFVIPSALMAVFALFLASVSKHGSAHVMSLLQ